MLELIAEELLIAERLPGREEGTVGTVKRSQAASVTGPHESQRRGHRPTLGERPGASPRRCFPTGAVIPGWSPRVGLAIAGRTLAARWATVDNVQTIHQHGLANRCRVT